MKYILAVLTGMLLLGAQPASAGTVSYTYDDAGRLTKADYGAKTIFYTYDAAGNLLKRKVADSEKTFEPCAVEESGTSALHQELLRDLRDLRLSPAAPDLVTLYYRHAPEMARILSRNPSLKSTLQSLIKTNAPKISSLVNSGTAAIDKEKIDGITAFILQLKAKGSAKLQNDLAGVVQQFESGELGNRISLLTK
ncbi:hypothetical protein ACFL43_01140 [Thermodesulfobacteriota bacterium]